MALKVWDVIFSGNKKEYSKKVSHLERRAFEVYLRNTVYDILKPPVVVVCIEVEPNDLGVMLEVVNESEIMNRFTIQQQENPYQFLIARNTTNLFD